MRLASSGDNTKVGREGDQMLASHSALRLVTTRRLPAIIAALELTAIPTLATPRAEAHRVGQGRCSLVLRAHKYRHSANYFILESCAKRVCVLVLRPREYGRTGNYWLLESCRWKVKR